MDPKDDVMQNATPISQISLTPQMQSMNDATSMSSDNPTSYTDILKSMEVAKQPPQISQQPQHTQMQSQVQMTPQMQMQSQQMQMPQSAPVMSMPSMQEIQVQQSPLMSNLLPDPMFFQPPPPPPQPKPQPVERRRKKEPKFTDKFDMSKIKPAILVCVIVFALLSWGAPVIAKRLAWTVDSLTGKFTNSGLIVISALTGGVFLGISEIIRNFGSGF